VFVSRDELNRFNGFLHAAETVETVLAIGITLITQLKQGVNERHSRRTSRVCEIYKLKLELQL